MSSGQRRHGLFETLRSPSPPPTTTRPLHNHDPRPPTRSLSPDLRLPDFVIHATVMFMGDLWLRVPQLIFHLYTHNWTEVYNVKRFYKVNMELNRKLKLKF